MGLKIWHRRWKPNECETEDPFNWNLAQTVWFLFAVLQNFTYQLIHTPYQLVSFDSIMFCQYTLSIVVLKPGWRVFLWVACIHPIPSSIIVLSKFCSPLWYTNCSPFYLKFTHWKYFPSLFLFLYNFVCALFKTIWPEFLLDVSGLLTWN